MAKKGFLSREQDDAEQQLDAARTEAESKGVVTDLDGTPIAPGTMSGDTRVHYVTRPESRSGARTAAFLGIGVVLGVVATLTFVATTSDDDPQTRVAEFRCEQDEDPDVAAIADCSYRVPSHVLFDSRADNDTQYIPKSGAVAYELDLDEAMFGGVAGSEGQTSGEFTKYALDVPMSVVATEAFLKTRDYRDEGEKESDIDADFLNTAFFAAPDSPDMLTWCLNDMSRVVSTVRLNAANLGSGAIQSNLGVTPDAIRDNTTSVYHETDFAPWRNIPVPDSAAVEIRLIYENRNGETSVFSCPEPAL